MCLCSMFHLLCRLSSCDLDTSSSSSQVAILHMILPLENHDISLIDIAQCFTFS
ncbi:hypothetical protein GW17_00049327 [Ensete ventricosum]|nr:hypothetical protein GW17_00049327 [Ensete ventricosum]